MYNNVKDKYSRLELCNELVTDLIILRSILKDTVKIERILRLEKKG